MLLKFKIFLYKYIFTPLELWFLLNLNLLVRSQLKNTASIPIIIINFNQLYYLKQLVNFLVLRKFQNIIIVDNNSTFQPLLDYYKDLPANVTVEYMTKNYGHMVFFKSKELKKKYSKGFFVVTDADIVPNKSLPEDFMKQMIAVMLKYERKKVVFALRIDDLPETYPLREKVLNWEKRFWAEEL